MFFLKHQIESGVEIPIPIYTDSIYTRCQICKQEVYFDERQVAELINSGGSLSSTVVICSECSEKETCI